MKDVNQEATKVEIIPFEENVIAQAFREENGVMDLFDQMRSKVEGLVFDKEDPIHRAEMKSLAYAIARSKTAVDDFGKGLVKPLKDQANIIDKQRKYFVDNCKELQASVRAPLTEWEAQEKAKVDAVLEKIQSIKVFSEISFEKPVEEIKSRLEKIKEKELSEDVFGDLLPEAKLTKYEAIEKLEQTLKESEQFHAAEAEKIEKIKAEAIEKQKADAEAREKQLILERDQAAEKERQKIAYEQQQEKAKEAARQQDVEHRRKINSELLGSICATGMLDEDQAKEFIKLIHKGEIKNLKITY